MPHDIFDLLTPVALAFWIQGDGSYRRGGLVLCTDNFTIQEVVLLMNVLVVKFQLDVTTPKGGMDIRESTLKYDLWTLYDLLFYLSWY